MSVAAITWAFQQKDLTPSQKIVLLYLADCYNAQNSLCFPSTERMSEFCCMSRATVFRRLKELREKGLISWTPRMVDGRQTTSLYVLGHEGSQNETLILETLGSEGLGLMGETGEGLTGDIAEPEVGNRKDIDTGVSISETKPSLESALSAFADPPGTNGSDDAEKSSPTQQDSSPQVDGRQLRKHFLAWWSVYPKQVGEEDAKNLYYRACKRGDFKPGDLLMPTKVAARAWKDEEREERYIPLAVNFIYRKMWKDFVPKKKIGATVVYLSSVDWKHLLDVMDIDSARAQALFWKEEMKREGDTDPFGIDAYLISRQGEHRGVSASSH